MSEVKLTKEMVTDLLQKNEGFSRSTQSSNKQESRHYFIKESKLYMKKSGNISFAGVEYNNGDGEECDYATTKRILERFFYQLNK